MIILYRREHPTKNNTNANGYSESGVNFKKH